MNIKIVIAWIMISTVSFSVAAEKTGNRYSNIPGVDCVINPYKVADIASPVAGVIENLFVERSQPVSAGQVVAQLDADVEKANVKLARYRADIVSEIKLGQVNMKFDKRRNNRIHSLEEKQVISIEHIDEAEREAGLSRWKLKQAKELATVRKLELRRAEKQLQQKSIRAPFDGYVLDTYRHRGEYVENQSIMRLAQLDPLVIEAIVPMADFGKIKVGMSAEILPETATEQKLSGTVSIVDRIGDAASNTFGVRLVMENPDNRIPAGLKCIVKFLEQDGEIANTGIDKNNPVVTEKAIVAAMKSRRAQAEKTQALNDKNATLDMIVNRQ